LLEPLAIDGREHPIVRPIARQFVIGPHGAHDAGAAVPTDAEQQVAHFVGESTAEEFAR